VGALVLIVDDDERNARLAADVLEHAGLRTLTAATARDGIDAARAHRPDVVLLDLRLPDLDGEAAAQELANDPATASIPVVALSALPADDWPGHPAFAGYVEKPIDVRALPAQVRRHCRR
jgi:two-component system cell cycle response regulator DivK